MKVLLLGMSRTGTMFLYTAMKDLGFRPYHMLEAFQRPSDFQYWNEALRAKFHGVRKPYGRAEFDKLLGEHDAISDMPACLFIDELTTAYPDAKIVVTTRDVDRWFQSMNKTLFHVLYWPSWKILRHLDTELIGPWHTCLSLLCERFPAEHPKEAKTAFLDHYAHIRNLGKTVLELTTPYEYKPLCEFLGVDIPLDVNGHEVQFPKINDTEGFLGLHERMRNRAFVKIGARVMKAVLPLLVVILGVFVVRWVF